MFVSQTPLKFVTIWLIFKSLWKTRGFSHVNDVLYFSRTFFQQHKNTIIMEIFDIYMVFTNARGSLLSTLGQPLENEQILQARIWHGTSKFTVNFISSESTLTVMKHIKDPITIKKRPVDNCKRNGHFSCISLTKMQ